MKSSSRDALYRENKELEKILQGYDKELNYIKSNFPQNLGMLTCLLVTMLTAYYVT